MPVYYNPSIHGEGTVCPRCRVLDATPWKNPLLVTLRKLGIWTGPVMGGLVVCAACEPLVIAESKPKLPETPFAATHIPRDFADAAWSNFEPRPGSETAVTLAGIWYKAHDDRNIYIHGGVGAGKTRLASTLARAWWTERNKAVIFCTAVDLFDRLRAAEFHPAGDAGLFTLEHLVECALLVLDDLGAEKPTEYTCARLLALLDRRHQVGHPTIVTSNLDLNDLGLRMGDDRIPSRLADWSDIVVLRSTDYRVERATKRRRR